MTQNMTTLAIKIDPNVKDDCRQKAEAEGSTLSKVGRQLWLAWRDGKIQLQDTVEVTVKEAE